MAGAVTLAAIFIRYVIFSDVIAAFPTEQQDKDPSYVAPFLDLPPVLYEQTPGPLYIKDPRQYYRIWCNGTEGARVTWTYNGQNISDPAILQQVTDREGVHFTFPEPQSVLLYDRNEKIHGYIQCFVTNNRGSTFGDKVFVSHAVLNFTEEGERTTTVISRVGDTVTLSCDDHIQDLPTANIRWYKDNKNQEIDPIRRSGFFCNPERSVCVISHAKLTDSGWFICKFTIPGKPKVISKRFEMFVNEPSDYDPYSLHPLNLIDHVSSPSTVEAQTGDNVQLQCAFRGTREGDIQWTRGEATAACSFHEKDVLSNGTTSNKYTISKNGTHLNINNFTADDEGFYLCSADNSFDRYTHRIVLKLVAPPVLSEKIFGVETYIGGAVRLNCSVNEAIPAAKTTWWVNTEVVTQSGLGKYRLDDGGATLVLYNASLEDTSSIACNVSNRVGSMLGHRYIAVRNITKTPPDMEIESSSDSLQPTIDLMESTETSTTDQPNIDKPTTEAPSTDGTSVERDPTDGQTENTTYTKVGTSRANKALTANYDVTEPDDDESHSAEIDVDPATKTVVSDPTYFVETKSNERTAVANGRIGIDSPKPWQQSAWPWILITICVFLLGLVVGVLSTRCYLSRHKADDIVQEKNNVIENSPMVSAYKLKCSASSAEAESMMHGSIQQETVT